MKGAPGSDNAENSASSSHQARENVIGMSASDTSSSCYQCRNESLVVKEVVKPISYAATSTVDGNKDVLVLFQALRANGKEVIVDNKFLRESYPLLLLDFYEKNINYDCQKVCTLTPTISGNQI